MLIYVSNYMGKLKTFSLHELLCHEAGSLGSKVKTTLLQRCLVGTNISINTLLLCYLLGIISSTTSGMWQLTGQGTRLVTQRVRFKSPQTPLNDACLVILTLPYHRLLAYLNLSYVILPYLSLPNLNLDYLSYITLPYHTSPFLNIPYHTLPYLTLYLSVVALISYKATVFFPHYALCTRFLSTTEAHLLAGQEVLDQWSAV